MGHDGAVEIVPAQRRIATRGNHFEHALGQAQNGNIERAAAQVIHRVNAFGGLVQPIGDGRRGRLVEQAQHIQAGQPRGIARGLALRVVEIRRHGDHRAHQVVAQHVFGALAQHGQDLRRDFDRAEIALDRAQAYHAGRVDELVRRAAGRGVGRAAAHEALDRDDGVQRIARLLQQGLAADSHRAAVQVAHGRRQQDLPLRVGQHFGHAAAHRGHQRIGRAQVYTHGQLALVRGGRIARLGNLQ
ncbi:NAD-specific glutamate dehydrogenase [Bordetella pertussis]|nr:NAD-specific glutamate dehydrogenase [Bordetella pertussis]CFL79960.1 NAD-specific glutamate dehydrogenase [Bordetella pertussis]CFM16638.1 NAD-specific glutamate dehydrogenase [Bordetella pertussis]CFM28575.1 NAD-specific glutamate dehydrogenase [Bordetella pertussis]CFM46649.1 NAD-specific glutamate dehydrogenase [Bordetella pertussis]